jgi:DNA-binding NarL/FixJ family response regulator
VKYASRARKRKRRGATEHDDVLELVRQGVRRFILKDAPIGDFRRAVRAAARKGELSSHPLTGVVFRRIVKEAIRERKDRTSRE